MSKALRNFLIALVGVIIVSGGLAFFLINQQSKENAYSLIRETFAALEAGGLEPVENEVRRIESEYGSWPEARFLALVVDLVEGVLNPEDAGERLREIVPTPNFSPLMHYRLVRTALDGNHPDLVESFLGGFFQRYPGHPLFHKAVAFKALRDEDLNLALLELEKVEDAGRADDETKLLLARILRESPAMVDRLKAKVIYREMAREKGSIGFAAALELFAAQQVPRSAEESVRYLEQLTEHPYFLNPENEYLADPDYGRALAKVLSAYNPPAALHVLSRMEEGGTRSLEDRKLQIYLLIQDENLRTADRKLDSLEAEFENDPDLEALRAYYYFLNREIDAAFSFIAQKDIHTDGSAYFLSILQAVQQARAEDLVNSEVKAINEYILDLPETTPQQQIFAWSRILAIQPLYRDELLQEAIAGLSDHPLLVADWLNENGRYAETLEVLSEERVREDPAFFNPYFIALIGEDRTMEAEAILESMSSRLSEDDVLLARVLFQARADDEATFVRAWDEAYSHALTVKNSNLMLSLAQYAHQQDFEERAYRAYRQCFLDNFLPGLEDWLRSLAYCFPREDFDFLVEIATRTAERFEKNPIVINNRAYLAFLQGEEVAGYVEQLEDLVDSFPQSVNLRMTLAMGYLLQEKEEDALELVQDLVVDWNEESEQSQMILAATLSANNQRAFANTFISNIDPAAFISEERDYFETFIPGFGTDE